MRASRPWEQRLTPFDLFEEKKRVTLLWRLVTIASTWLMAIGYLLYPFAIRHKDSSLQVSKAILATSIILIIIGHTLEGFTILRQRAILFWLEDLFVPIVQITFLTGILAPIFHVAFRNTASLALPCIFVISGVSLLIHIPSLLLVNRRISHIEKEDSLRRQRVSFTPANLWPERFGSQKSASNNSFGSGRQSVKRSLLPDDAIHLPEDEAQRQQLLKLLLKKENESRPPVVTGPQGGGVQTTYRVDIPVPDDSESVRRRDLSLLTTFSPSKSFPTWNHPSSESNTYGSTWQSGNVIGSDTYRSEESQDSVPSLQHKSDSPINVRMGSNHNRETSFLSTGSNSEYSTYQSRNEPEPQPQPQWQTPLPKLQQTPSQVDRERRRREIELGESRLLPSYSGNGITESHRDSKVTWGSRHG